MHSMDESKKTCNKRIKKMNPSGKDWNKNSRGGSGKSYQSRKKELSKKFWLKTVAMDKRFLLAPGVLYLLHVWRCSILERKEITPHKSQFSLLFLSINPDQLMKDLQ